MGAPGTTKTIDRERQRAASMTRARPVQVNSAWTAERVDLLAELWARGDSCSQIAKEINRRLPGGSLSRNAIISKVYRLCLPGRAAPSRPTAARVARQPRAPAVARATQQNAGLAFGISRGPSKLPEPLPVREDVAPTATLDTLTSRSCRYPIGDPQAPDFGFCGRLKDLDQSYCESHRKIAFRGVPAERTEAQLAGDAKRRAAAIRRASAARVHSA